MLALPLLLVSLLAVLRAPHGALWLPRIAATEAGHGLAVISLGVAVAGDGWTTALGSAAAVLFSVPLLRAIPVAAALPGRLAVAFGGPVRPGVPLSADRLLAGPTPRVPVATHRYGDGHPRLMLDLYGAPQGARPLVVAVHGGSWTGGDSTQLSALYHRLAARGVAVAALNYPLAPEAVFPAQTDAVVQAVAWLRAQGAGLGVDPRRVVLFGRSAGGHLALRAGLSGDVPDLAGVIGLYAPTDLGWGWDHPTNPRVLDTPATLAAFLGGTPDQVPGQFADSSVLDCARDRSPPTLLIHGGGDELVWHAHSERLHARLQGLGVRSLLLSLPWATHGCEALLGSPSGQLTAWAVEDFLERVWGGGSG